MSIIMVDTELVLDTMKAYDNYVYNDGWYWIGHDG